MVIILLTCSSSNSFRNASNFQGPVTMHHSKCLSFCHFRLSTPYRVPKASKHPKCSSKYTKGEHLEEKKSEKRAKIRQIEQILGATQAGSSHIG
ncbi:hypothetical protein V6Z12_D13G170700 [Gossypium hirsutum]